MTIEAEVFEEHALQVGFLWSMRDTAARDPGYGLPGLCDLDGRIEAHLDGLRLAGEDGWACCKALLDEAEGGEVFAAAAIAMDRGDLRGVAHVLDVAAADPVLARGIVSALGWVAFEQLQRILPGLLDSRCPPDLHFLGIAACSAHRRDPGPALGYAVVSPDPRLRARALRAVGELGRSDLIAEIRHALADADPHCRFAAAWSAALLGEPSAAQVLWELASREGPHAAEACDMAMRRMPPATAYSWLHSLANGGSSPRAALAGAAALGDPALVPWILECAAVPESARAAGGALATITGLDLKADKLAARAPAGFKSGPNDDPKDTGVAMDPEESLPWPDAAALHAYWDRESSRFKRGTRYLMGKPLTTPGWLKEVLRIGSQPARAGAALELHLQEPRRPVFEVRAPGFRQQRELAWG